MSSQADPYAFRVIPENMHTVIVFTFVSLFATGSLLTVLSYNAIKKYIRSRKQGYEPSTPHILGYFWLVNLFVSEFVQCLGSSITTNHFMRNAVLPGPLCTLQGVLVECGDVASSLWSFVIAAHTFILLAGGPRMKAWVAEKGTSGKARWILCIGIWLGVVFLSVIGPLLVRTLHPERGPFYNNAGAGWCWIEADYFWERIFFLYFFLFIDMFSLTTIYCILFVYIRIKARNIRQLLSTNASERSYEMSQTWRADPETGTHSSLQSTRQTKTKTKVTVEDRPSHQPAAGERTCKRMNHASLILISYPAVYICLTMPMCIARICQFTGKRWSLPAVYAGTTIYVCSGAVNVLVYTTTRRGIIPWGRLFRKFKPAKTNETSTKPVKYVPDRYDSGSDSEHLTPPRKLLSKSSASSIPTLAYPSSERFSGDNTKGSTEI